MGHPHFYPPSHMIHSIADPGCPEIVSLLPLAEAEIVRG